MSTRRWSEFSAEHEVRYTRNGKYFAITMSKTSGGAEGLYGGGDCGVRSRDQTGVLVGIITYEFPPSRVQPRVPIHMFGVEIAG
jgi:hypothetical protein